MSPRDVPAREKVIDEALERGPLDEAQDEKTEAGGSEDSPLRDYVREIQQEFEEQEDEGKIEP